MKLVFSTLSEIFRNRFLVRMVAQFELKKRYTGTLMGVVWVFLNPLITLLIYWFVFSVGLKIQPSGGVPFVLYFLAAMSAWSFFSETVNQNSGVIISNRHLVTKLRFPVTILPVSTLVTSLIGHLVSLTLLIVLMIGMGFPFALTALQVFFYFFLMCIMALGFGWLVAALNVFFRDVAEITRIGLSLWFWATPIVWNPQSIPEEYRWVLKINPMAVITGGYVDSFLYHKPLWEDPQRLLLISGFSGLVFVAGAFLFRKLSPTFAEVM